MDANFGVCWTKAAGNSVHPPLSGTELFFEQSVDNYVTQYQCHSGRGAQVLSVFSCTIKMDTWSYCIYMALLMKFRFIYYSNKFAVY